MFEVAAGCKVAVKETSDHNALSGEIPVRRQTENTPYRMQASQQHWHRASERVCSRSGRADRSIQSNSRLSRIVDLGQVGYPSDREIDQSLRHSISIDAPIIA